MGCIVISDNPDYDRAELENTPIIWYVVAGFVMLVTIF